MLSNSSLVNELRQNDVLTNNGAVTNSTSLNNILDLFFICGASRTMSEDSIIKMFDAALAENTLLTIKVLFYARDVRSGAGERRFFRICLRHLSNRYNSIYKNVIKYIPEYGRWDDMWCSADLVNTEVFSVIKTGLDEKNGLLAKWLPRKAKTETKKFYFGLLNYLGLSQKDYRKKIVSLSNTVEQQICSNKWEDVEYNKVPSQAFKNYRKAFLKHDQTRFNLFLESVEKGEAKINANAIYPYQLYNAINLNGSDNKSVELQWNNLPNFMENSKERILPMCDVSGSMGSNNGLPMAMSVSLGIYISERNEGIFKNAFMTFTSKPTMQYLTGSLTQRISQIKGPVGYDTNFVKAFEVILEKALEKGLTQGELPTMILAISDMEFNSSEVKGKSVTAFQSIKNRYEEAGFQMPKLVFWNVNGRELNVPVSSNTINTALVSGASPSILKSILNGDDFTPVGIMLTTLNSKRYERIAI